MSYFWVRVLAASAGLAGCGEGDRLIDYDWGSGDASPEGVLDASWRESDGGRPELATWPPRFIEVQDRTPAGSPLEIVQVNLAPAGSGTRVFGRVRNGGDRALCDVRVESGLLVDAERAVLGQFSTPIDGTYREESLRTADWCLEPGALGVFSEYLKPSELPEPGRVDGLEAVLTWSDSATTPTPGRLEVVGTPTTEVQGSLLEVQGELANTGDGAIALSYIPVVVYIADPEGRLTDHDFDFDSDLKGRRVEPAERLPFVVRLEVPAGGVGELLYFPRWEVLR